MNITTLQTLSPLPVLPITDLADIPREGYMVYILIHNEDDVLVVGHGKYNRARVICDDQDRTTSGHIKAMKVRCAHLFGIGEFSRFVIPCESKTEAKELEGKLHSKIGGNTLPPSAEIQQKLWEGIATDSPEAMVLNIALHSAFDGLYDLKRWRKKGILTDDVWNPIASKLGLQV